MEPISAALVCLLKATSVPYEKPNDPLVSAAERLIEKVKTPRILMR